ncbi:MAG TPA: response regulator transcription factor [Gemmatimonadaceae bacterium]|nr:response regulator transcription factor [Gemmatimonadaceae bacterium]
MSTLPETLGVDAIGAAVPLPVGPRVVVAPRPIRVVIADGDALVRSGLRALLATAADVVVVGEAASAAEAVALATARGADVVLVDVAIPESLVGGGIAATARALAREAPSAHVLALSTHVESELLPRVLREGARGCLGKDSASRELVPAVRAVAAGGVYATRPTRAIGGWEAK